jgi:hypothetical protein
VGGNDTDPLAGIGQQPNIESHAGGSVTGNSCSGSRDRGQRHCGASAASEAYGTSNMAKSFQVAREGPPRSRGDAPSSSAVGPVVLLTRKLPITPRLTELLKQRREPHPRKRCQALNVAPIRYVRNVPVTGALMLRSAVAMFFASAPFALLSAVAHAGERHRGRSPAGMRRCGCRRTRQGRHGPPVQAPCGRS